ncbi:MlaD family protein [Salipiger mucosus]|uniref:ABC-type transport system n=1 Tax=Salipiger mucosus DSM 16094 TaxID=1123237 RepID=S9RL13_9RHOB|nr:MlaD family protein [Salipiger mucosus]EPX78830.1 ABC-type transport system [Salipiger mucosus DSM 16094]
MSPPRAAPGRRSNDTETRANYVLIGAFAIAGVLGILGFFLWFARIELDRQFAYYDIDFRSVSGLSDASDVRFAGLPVGQVVDVGLSPANNGRVRVRVEVAADTPVRADSIATIEAQGVTGVSFVGISAGSADAPLLSETSDDPVPRIEAGQSVLQSISQDAPEILSEMLEVVREMRRLVSPENRQRVEAILGNVESASGEFTRALDDFSAVSNTVSDFAGEIGRFNETLDRLTGDVSGVLETADTALASVDRLAGDAGQLVEQGSQTLSRLEAPIASADRYITEDLGPATRQLRESVAEIEAQLSALGARADALMQTYARTGEAATARLTEARETLEATDALIARFDATLASVDGAAQRIDALVAGDGQALVSELRTATTEATEVIRSIGKTARDDLPEIVADIRAASATASETFETLGRDLGAASGRVDALVSSADTTLDTVRDSFERANETLGAINAALETGDRAMGAAERAFDGADRFMNEDLDGITERLQSTLDVLEAAVGDVAEDIPAVTEELRAASRSAEAAFAQIRGVVGDSAPAVRDFATTALPQYGRLAVETRALIDTLDALFQQIRRDPGRFLLEPRAPEYRR